MNTADNPIQRRFLDPICDWSVDRHVWAGRWVYYLNNCDGFSVWDLGLHLPISFGTLLWNLAGVANYEREDEIKREDKLLDQATDREQAERDDDTEAWKNEIAVGGSVE